MMEEVVVDEQIGEKKEIQADLDAQLKVLDENRLITLNRLYEKKLIPKNQYRRLVNKIHKKLGYPPLLKELVQGHIFTLFRGSLKNFDRKKEFCQDRIKDFSIHHKGASKRINYTKSDNRLEFFDTYTPGIFLCNMVKKNIRDYIAIHGQPKPTSYYDKMYTMKRFNLKLIEENVGMPMYGIDCDYFYFMIAFQMGFINERTLKKALEKKEEYKQARLAAIGSLNSRTWVEVFENGVKVRDEYDTKNYDIYHPFYWMIIKRAYDLMEEAFEKFNNVACMWLTDCIYTTVSGKKQLEEFFKEKGFEYKYFAMDFLSIDYDNSRVHWHDCKSRSDKNIRFSKYDLTYEIQ